MVYRAALHTCFHKNLDYQPQKYKHPALNPSQIKKDENGVQRILAIIETTFGHKLMSISTGVSANEKVESDILFAKEQGQEPLTHS